MIVRVLTAHVPSSDAPAAIVVLRQTLAQMQGQPGLEYAKLARRLVDDGEELVLFQEWATPADLYQWTGGDLRRPRLHGDLGVLVRNLVITHYESLDRTPAELGLDLVESDADGGANSAQG